MAWGERCPTPARMGAECGDRKASLTASPRPSAKRCGDVLGLSACVGPSESAHGAQGFSAVEPLPLAALTRAVVVSDCAWM